MRKAKQPLTTSGFIPTDAGYQQLAGSSPTASTAISPMPPRPIPRKVHAAVKQKDWFWNNDYNILNGVHTHGQRYNPFGPAELSGRSAENPRDDGPARHS